MRASTARTRARFAGRLLGTLVFAAVTAHAGTAATAPLRMQWELAATADSGSEARVMLTNLEAHAWPAAGWSLYFNCLSGVKTGPLADPFEVDHLPGTLYRLRPTAAFKGLAPGAAVVVRIVHEDWPFNASKAPLGPYVVFDSAPAHGLPVADFSVVPPLLPREVDAEALYRRYADSVPLPPEEVPPVFPTPQRLERGTGTLHWSAMPAITAAPRFAGEIALAREYLAPYLSPRAAASDARHRLTLVRGRIAGNDSPEAYELRVDPGTGVRITANSAAGMARGLASLRELLPTYVTPESGTDLPAVIVTDAPRFPYRGVMLDVARNFQPKVTVLALLDAMARLKFNVLHLHLTDDEGWRVPIGALPELTTVGANRGHTLDSAEHLPPAYGSGPAAGEPPGSGAYARAEYLEILRYAAARHIEVIPEIEMPGHARAAVEAMEHRARAGDTRYRLADPDDASNYSSAQLYTDNVMNPGLDSTYAFIETVVAGLAALHREAGVPLATLHLGGDELPDGAWENSPATRALMQREGFTTRAEVWNYFYTRVTAMLEKRGIAAAGWEELGARRGADGKLEPNPLFLEKKFTLQVWNTTAGAEDLANRLANAGYGVVLSPATRYYLDMAHFESSAEPGMNWAAFVDLDAVYDFEPLDATRRAATDPAPLADRVPLTAAGAARVRGIEGTLFSETVRDTPRLQYMLMPRLFALAERAWAPRPEWLATRDAARAAALRPRAWATFASQLGQRVLPRLDAEKSGIRYRIAPPGLHLENGAVHVNQQLPGFTLRYTADGREPGVRSPPVTGPITKRGRIRVSAFNRDGRHSRPSSIDNDQ